MDVSNTGGTPITCDQIGAQAVTAVLRNRAIQGARPRCSRARRSMGMSQPLIPGIYDIGFDLNGGRR